MSPNLLSKSTRTIYVIKDGRWNETTVAAYISAPIFDEHLAPVQSAAPAVSPTSAPAPEPPAPPKTPAIPEPPPLPASADFNAEQPDERPAPPAPPTIPNSPSAGPDFSASAEKLNHDASFTSTYVVQKLKLANLVHLVESGKIVAITKHAATRGYFVPLDHAREVQRITGAIPETTAFRNFKGNFKSFVAGPDIIFLSGVKRTPLIAFIPIATWDKAKNKSGQTPQSPITPEPQPIPVPKDFDATQPNGRHEPPTSPPTSNPPSDDRTNVGVLTADETFSYEDVEGDLRSTALSPIIQSGKIVSVTDGAGTVCGHFVPLDRSTEIQRQTGSSTSQQSFVQFKQSFRQHVDSTNIVLLTGMQKNRFAAFVPARIQDTSLIFDFPDPDDDDDDLDLDVSAAPEKGDLEPQKTTPSIHTSAPGSVSTVAAAPAEIRSSASASTDFADPTTSTGDWARDPDGPLDLYEEALNLSADTRRPVTYTLASGQKVFVWVDSGITETFGPIDLHDHLNNQGLSGPKPD